MNTRTSVLWRLAASLLAASAVLAVGFSALAPGELVLAQGATRVRIGVLAVVPEAGYFVGIDQGYFREQGIELDVTQFDSAARMVPSLGTGQLDAGDGSHSAGLFNAAARDVGIKLVADAGSGPPGQSIVALLFRRELVDSGQLRGPGDLRGRRLALPARAIPTEVLLSRWLRTANLRLDDLDIVEMGFPDQIPALGTGVIDATIMPEPFQTRVVESGLATLHQRDNDIYPGFQVAEVLYGAAFAREQPELGRRLMIAYLRGVRVYNDAFVKGDPAARQITVEALIQHTPVKDPALYDRMTMAGLNPDGRINLASIAEDQDYWLASGAQQTRIDLESLVDYSFVDAALQVLGPYR
jgi:NitT/TauT family transport system substrate-binding protein